MSNAIMLFLDFAENLERKPEMALFFIVILGIFLRLLFFSGMDVSDSLEYSRTAYDIKNEIVQNHEQKRGHIKLLLEHKYNRKVWRAGAGQLDC